MRAPHCLVPTPVRLAPLVILAGRVEQAAPMATVSLQCVIKVHWDPLGFIEIHQGSLRFIMNHCVSFINDYILIYIS